MEFCAKNSAVDLQIREEVPREVTPSHELFPEYRIKWLGELDTRLIHVDGRNWEDVENKAD